jgi:hypothetical protein
MTKFKKSTVCFAAMTAFILGVGVTGSFAQTEPSSQVKDGIALLKEKAAKLGTPKVENGILYFGNTKINDDFTVVDEVKDEKGCTATFFVKDGDNFLRVSTNVMTDGSVRAVGTNLNVRGKAFEALSKGESFYGVIDVVGKNYDTGYEPIKDASGTIVGVYYVGFPQ